ncbi:MAG: Asp-tRNA(Asn)/Glu-tRNA(Gln) amidotransferase subunit GatC [Nitrospirota bacterium]
MRITKEEIEHIGVLARLALSDEEKEKFGSQLSNVLEYVEKLNELNTDNVEPTSHVLSLSNIMREDTPRDSLPWEEALRNAPAHADKFYRVPKIIE